jgi:hypothetical protein
VEDCLRELFSDQIETYELRPLSNLDIVEVGNSEGLNGEKLLNEVWARNLQALAEKPITLQMLLKLANQAREQDLNTYLPPTLSLDELYERGCRLFRSDSFIISSVKLATM